MPITLLLSLAFPQPPRACATPEYQSAGVMVMRSTPIPADDGGATIRLWPERRPLGSRAPASA